MVKFCPSCGSELYKEFNFCPACGYDLRNVSDKVIKGDSETKPLVGGVIICDNCGEENDPDNKVCSYCGAPLKGTKIEKVKEEKKYSKEKETIPLKRKEPKKSVSGTKGTTFKSSGKSKELDTKKILLILAGVVAVVFIILVSSGILSSTAPEKVVQNQGSDQSSGVNLNNIQQINELQEKVNNNPNDTESLLELAHLKNDSGMYEQAIGDYKKYLEKVPEDADARIDLGVCYYNLHNYDEAIKQMEKAISYSPKHQIGYLNLGIVNLAAGNLDKSKEWLEKAVQLDPNSEVGKRAKELLDSHSK